MLRRRAVRSGNQSVHKELQRTEPDEVVYSPPTQPSVSSLPGRAFVALFVARILSAILNLIHDCDEVFNYWEPLHFLLYGSGLQTWEYSSQFALRSYWYLALHAMIAGPFRIFADEKKGQVVVIQRVGIQAGGMQIVGWYSPAQNQTGTAGKLFVFFGLRIALAVISFLTELWLVRGLEKRVSPTVARLALGTLTICSGCFIASTALLPSSFTMVALTAGTASMLHGHYDLTIVVSVAGVIWGWCVAGVAFVPLALATLLSGNVLRRITVLGLAILGACLPLIVADRAAYGRWTVSLWNFVRYNVVGGGDSALYGVESWTYYLRNGIINFQLMLPLVLVSPLAIWFAGLKGNAIAGAHLIVAPVFLWAEAITALPHKEERFLFVVYPLACVAAAISLFAIQRAVECCFSSKRMLKLSKATAQALATWMTRFVMALLVLGSLARLTVVLTGFWLPGQGHQLQFVASGFEGLLPLPFNASQGGTAAAPLELNDRNQASPATFWPDASGCDYFVTQKLRSPGNESPQYLDGGVLGPLEQWETVAAVPFLNTTASPQLTRTFYIPWLSSRYNQYDDYVLLRRKSVLH